MRLGSYDGAWYIEHNGIMFVTGSQILMEWGRIFVHQDNICNCCSRLNHSSTQMNKNVFPSNRAFDDMGARGMKSLLGMTYIVILWTAS